MEITPALPAPVPRFFDNSLLSLYKDCPQKYYLAVVEGWRANGEAPALSFGTSYHKCIEVYDRYMFYDLGRGAATNAALQEAAVQAEKWTFVDTYRNKLSLFRAVVWYDETYWASPLKTLKLADGTPALELSFQFDLPLPHPEGGNYTYCGHIDKLAEYDSQVYAVERKHTTSALTDSYFDRYIFSSQVEGYVFGGNVCFSRNVMGAMIESAQIGVNFVRFGIRPVVRVNDRLEEWLSDTSAWIKRIEDSYVTNSWPRNKESCGKYSGCQFKEVCFRSPGARRAVLEYGFHEERWQPEVNR